jgi:hypothetical protein
MSNESRPQHWERQGNPKTREEARESLELAIRAMLALRAMVECDSNPHSASVPDGEFYGYIVDDCAWWLAVAKEGYKIDASDLRRGGTQ